MQNLKKCKNLRNYEEMRESLDEKTFGCYNVTELLNDLLTDTLEGIYNMKKFFGKKNRDQWEEFEEEVYDWDDTDGEDQEAYYAQEDEEDLYAEDAQEDGEAFYAEDAQGDGEAFYAEDAQEDEEAFYAESAEGEDPEILYAEESEAGYYASDEGDDDAYTGEPEYYEAEEESYYGEEAYEDDMPYAEPVYPKRNAKSRADGPKKKDGNNPLAAFWAKLVNMSAMDRVITITGVAVLVLALVTGSVYISAKAVNEQIHSFADVGTALEGIEVIGQEGLMAVANARMSVEDVAQIVEEQEKKEYEEAEYSKSVTVQLNMTSIQKDLKIKFVNKNTGKLVANVPFQVTVTTPDKKTETWSDDDLDGIIYKKDITPGSYKVAVTALTDEKYADYTMPDGSQTVEVKKDIAYQKVDVADEVKKESEINASKEDTKKNETVVESTLQDTVEWVESTNTANSYVEVAKSSIADPTTLVKSGSFLRAAATGSASLGSASIETGKTTTASAAVSEGTLKTVTWSSSDTSVATVNGSGTSATVTGVKAGTATISFTGTAEVPKYTSVSGNQVEDGMEEVSVSGTCTVTVTAVVLDKGTVTVNPASLAVAVKGTATAQASMTGFTAGQAAGYTVASSNTGVATAVIDGAGKITVTGVAAGEATITVTGNYTGMDSSTAATAAIAVKVTGTLAVSLDKTTASVFISAPITLNATVSGASTTTTAVTAESSDTGVATVAVSGRAVTVTGVKAGSATITIKYTENGQTAEAKCTVTVKNHPKDDKATKLKDTSGNQLFVQEGGSYREAVYADYYSASKFYIKGAVKYTGWQTIDGKVYFFKADGTKVTGEQIIQGAKYNFASDGSLVTGSGTMGIDVSKWNGSIDWNAVKNSGVSYVIIRCGYRGSSQGALIEDPKYRANIQGAIAAGLKVGVYFFTQAVDEREAVEEASMVLGLVKGYKISYPIFLDVESSGGRADNIDKSTRTAVVKAFCQTIQNAGYTAGVYANKNWLTSKMDAGALSAYKIWLAQYAAAPTYTGRYDLWQYKSNGKVSGISGNVDMNLSYLGY